jgi:hypothetical protein
MTTSTGPPALQQLATQQAFVQLQSLGAQLHESQKKESVDGFFSPRLFLTYPYSSPGCNTRATS